jgi:hypothetical protein
MSKPKDKKEKYWPGTEINEMATSIITNCNNMFSYINLADFTFLFKKAKERADKNIKVRLIKEPISLISSKKVMVFVGNEWWDNNTHTDRTKALIEAFLSIAGSSDEGDHYEKRSYDVQTFSELLKSNQLDYSKFSNVLPAEKRTAEDLTLTAQ